MVDTSRYNSAGFGNCTKCNVKPTSHRSGICQGCRKEHNIKLDKHVLSDKAKKRGRKPTVAK